MEHKLCRDNLSAYLDGELPAEERGGVEAHLAGCAECRAELEQLKGVSGLLKKHVMEPVPLPLRKLALEPRPARPWLKPALALSAAAAGALVVLNLSRTPETPRLYDAGFGARSGMETALPAASPLAFGRAAPAEDADTGKNAAGGAGAAAGSSLNLINAAKEEKAAAPAAAAVRGSLSQAKYAAPRSASRLAGGAAGAKADAAQRNSPALLAGGSAGELKKAAPASQPAVRNYRAPVCVHVNAPPPDYEDDPALAKALDFMRKNCPATDQVSPGTLAFTKKDGRVMEIKGQEITDGIILFDGVQDPLLVTDFAGFPSVCSRYFGK